MTKRHLLATLHEELAHAPAVALRGPRQVGKTTLALQLANQQASVYLDLQSEADRAKLSSPELYLAVHAHELVILDEIHALPGLFPALRGLIDRYRRARRPAGHFLLLGSASMDLMVDLLLVRRLPPWSANPGKRLVKSPKVHVRDCGLVHALLGLSRREDLLGHPIVGASWEGFVVENVLDVATRAQRDLQASFYRSSSGAEIDLLLSWPGGRTWALEVKRSAAPKLERGFHAACEVVQPQRSIVVYPGATACPMGSGIEAMPLHTLLDELAAHP
ncbi:MAG: ATP-binding protein [Rubrivivax sp.]|nr:ATP-binding protein [Rubrivivax sp.]